MAKEKKPAKKPSVTGTCFFCNKTSRFPASQAGTTAECPQCGTSVALLTLKQQAYADKLQAREDLSVRFLKWLSIGIGGIFGLVMLALLSMSLVIWFRERGTPLAIAKEEFHRRNSGPTGKFIALDSAYDSGAIGKVHVVEIFSSTDKAAAAAGTTVSPVKEHDFYIVREGRVIEVLSSTETSIQDLKKKYLDTP